MSQNRAIASLTYSLLRVYRMALGEQGGPAWEAAPDTTKAKVQAFVEWIRTNDKDEKALEPSDLHRHWQTAKLIDGWKFGPAKSELLRTHPHMGLDFGQLQREHQAKNAMFLAMVRLLAPLVLALDRAEDQVQQVAKDSLIEQQGALLYITAMVNRFGGETGIVHLSKNDMHAALVCELMRHDTEDEGLILKVERPGAAPAKDPAVLDTSLPAGG